MAQAMVNGSLSGSGSSLSEASKAFSWVPGVVAWLGTSPHIPGIHLKVHQASF